MRVTAVLAVLSVVAGGFYGKLLHDRDKAAEHAAQAIAERPPSPAPPPPPKPAVVKKPPAEEKPAALLPSETRALEKARALVARGRFDEAERAARDAALGGSRALEAAAAALAGRARLFATLTHAIEPHPFAKARDLWEVSLASGVTHVARVLQESESAVVLALADGRQIEVRPERIARRERLAEDAWGRRCRSEVEKKRAELGEAGALEVYHVACEAFEAGLADLGVPLLERALALPGGGAIVDVYGSGDLDALHRAQEEIRREAGSPAPLGDSTMAEAPRRSRPRPTPPPPPPVRPVDVSPPPVTTDPRVSEKPPEIEIPPDEDQPPAPPPAGAPPPAPPPPPPPEPEPPVDEPPPDAAGDLARLEGDAHWRTAQDVYKEAVDAYRVSFAAGSSKQKEGIRRARALLEKARVELDAVPNDFGPDASATWDAFSARVNALLRDVKKRQAATGS